MLSNCSAFNALISKTKFSLDEKTCPSGFILLLDHFITNIIVTVLFHSNQFSSCFPCHHISITNLGRLHLGRCQCNVHIWCNACISLHYLKHSTLLDSFLFSSLIYNAALSANISLITDTDTPLEQNGNIKKMTASMYTAKCRTWEECGVLIGDSLQTLEHKI